MHTPWGPSQYTDPLADGITVVSTASHGGIRLSDSRNQQVPVPLRIDSGWYEEDCEANLAIVAFPDVFSAEQVASARDQVREWFPDRFEAWTGEKVTADQSHVVAEREFFAAHADDLITVAAYGSWHESVPDGHVGVVARVGGRSGDGPDRYFLVPSADYDVSNQLGLVIDKDRHSETDAF